MNDSIIDPLIFTGDFAYPKEFAQFHSIEKFYKKVLKDCGNEFENTKVEGSGQDLHNGGGVFWDGQTGTDAEITKRAVAALKKIKITNVDFQKEVKIRLQYYEPQIPAKQVIYHFDEKLNVIGGPSPGGTPTFGDSKCGGEVGNDGTMVSFPSQKAEDGYFGPFYYTACGDVAGYLGATEDCVKGNTLNGVLKGAEQTKSKKLEPGGLINIVYYIKKLIDPSYSFLVTFYHYKPVGATGYYFHHASTIQKVDTTPYPEKDFPVYLGDTVEGSISSGGVTYKFASITFCN